MRTLVQPSRYRIRIVRRTRALDWLLVVDDSPLSARATARLLRGTFGVPVRIASDLQAVRTILSEVRVAPIAVVLDYELGVGETGLMALRLIRSLGVRAPCAFFTGAADKLRSQRGRGKIPVFARSGSPHEVTDWIASQRLAKTG